MEKLQKALQKAREQRGSAPEPIERLAMDLPAADSAAQSPDEGGTSALWDALESFEPSAKTLEKNRIVTASAGPLGASFDILRTKTMLTMRKNGWTRLAVTSPTMGCGKTTTSCNLAIGYARNPEVRTILLEFDLRRPSIAKTLDLPVTADVSDLLNGQSDFADHALRYRSNVAVVAASRPSPDPASLLTSKTTQRVLQDIEERYAPDIMIFDLPPLLVTDDTRAVLKDVDCAILVARAGSTTVSQIDICEREIAEHTNMLGVVLNQCRDMEDTHGYYG
jgi:protein-tyrosine kinase